MSCCIHVLPILPTNSLTSLIGIFHVLVIPAHPSSLATNCAHNSRTLHSAFHWQLPRDRLLRTIVVGVILWHGSLLHPAGDDAPTHDSFWSQGHENSLTHSLHNNNTTNDNNNNTILKGFAADDGNYIMWVVAITQSVDGGCSAAD